MYVYIKSEPELWTVGFYRPSGQWEPESDHASTDEAAARVAYLNGAGAMVDRVLASEQAAFERGRAASCATEQRS